MLYTPAALELALRWPFFSSVGDEDKPETAESTLVRSDVSADMIKAVGCRRVQVMTICFGFLDDNNQL